MAVELLRTASMCMCYTFGMTTKTYSAQISLAVTAPPEKVWDALVNPAVVQQYLHGTTMQADWRVGGAITWRGEWQGRPYEDKGTVLQFEPLHVISTTHWSPLSGAEDRPENYHVVTYELAETGKVQTTLTLIQSNSPTQQDADNTVEHGWKPVLQALKRVVEAS
jgi:uncharacterized protein YndB with AHSA1/START domain